MLSYVVWSSLYDISYVVVLLFDVFTEQINDDDDELLCRTLLFSFFYSDSRLLPMVSVIFRPHGSSSSSVLRQISSNGRRIM